MCTYHLQAYYTCASRDWESYRLFDFSICYAYCVFENLNNGQVVLFLCIIRTKTTKAILNEGAITVEERGKIEIKGMGRFSQIAEICLALFNVLHLS